MALTELKSDLSNFRKPIEKPLIENQSAEINRKSNLTPLSDLSKKLSYPSPLKETPVKSVVTPNSFDKTEKFKGETTPNKFNLESKFLGQTTPNYEKIEKFKGETTPTNFTFTPQFTTSTLKIVDFIPNTNADGFTSRMRESRFNFSSLSSPTPMKLEVKFLGETDPNKMSLESKFLGQTTPTPIDSTEKFKGQTTPNEIDDTEKFKGQTKPIPITFTPQFTATTPSNFTFTPQFTTPTLKIVDFISNTDAKGFTAKMKRTRSQFVDINRGQNTFTERIKNSKLGVVNFFSNEDAVGFTKNFNPGSKSQFRGISFNGREFTSNKPTTKLGVVDFFPNEDAVGFTKEFVDKTKSQFRGISADGEKFTSPKVTFGGDFGLSFLPGSKIKLEGSAAKYYQVGSQKWQPGGKRYEDNYVSIGDLLIRENSPSYLTKIYDQFNLKDDSFNPYPLFFRQPFILRGIQRKGNNKKEPQKWGLGGAVDSIMGVDLIRGGVLTSTERALVDVARIGQFILSPKGIVWSIMQVGMQRTNRFNKIWTPANLLLAVGGQHIGLKPKRHGLLPFDKIDVGNYERAIPLGSGKYKDKLEDLRKSIIVLGGLGNGLNNILLETQPGGPESVYGIGTSTIRTSTNTFSNPEKTYGDTKAGFVQKYNPIFQNPISLQIGRLLPISITPPRNADETIENTYGKEFGVGTNNSSFSKNTQNDDWWKKLGLLNSDNLWKQFSSALNKDNFGNSRYTNTTGDTNTHFNQKYHPFNEDLFAPEIENSYGNKAPIFADDEDNWENFGLSGKIFNSEYDDTNLFSSDDKNTLKAVTLNIEGEEALNYKNITDLSIDGGSYRDFRIKYKPEGTKISRLKTGIRKKYFGEDGKDYYKDKNIEKRVFLGNSDTTIGESTSGDSFADLVKLSFTTAGKSIQFRGTVNSINETFTPTWTEIKYSGRAENAYIYDTFTRELNFGFRVYAYSVGELKPMWQRLEKLGTMTMPTYGTSGYYGNITKFTLGTMYKDFPVLISSLQYAVPDEFTWEIGLNEGSGGNELPMGVDVTIGLKLLNHVLHTSNASKIYDFDRNKEFFLGTTMEDIREMNRTAVVTLAL